MKKNFWVIMLFLASVVSSCTQEPMDDPGGPSSPSTPSVDAAATLAAYDRFRNEGVDEFNAAGQAAVAGAFASMGNIVSRGESLSSTLTMQDLPSGYLLSTNPYEDAGIMHNRLVNLYISNGGYDSCVNKYTSYDSIFYDATYQLSTLSSLNSSFNRPMLYATAVTDSFARQGMHEVNAIVSINLQSDLYDYFPSFSASARKDSLVSFTSEVIYLTIHEGTTKEVMDYINQKITGLLEESEHLSNDVKKQIVYLTVMKHSWYLWRSNGYL